MPFGGVQWEAEIQIRRCQDEGDSRGFRLRPGVFASYENYWLVRDGCDDAGAADL